MQRILSLFTILTLAACSGADDAPPAGEAAGAAPEASAEEAQAHATIQALADRYADPDAALADGFMRDPTGMCVTADMVGLPASAGAMGVHYLHPARLGLIPDSEPIDGTDGEIVWNEPEVLVYEPQADGSERLVAVEYLVFQDAWHAAGNTAPPNFFGEPFVSMIDDPATEADESHGFAAHYELHIWVPRDNPTGMFAEFNPAVSCAHAAMAEMDMD
jgi:hypothetical protein